jgi:hypothetical protein
MEFAEPVYFFSMRKHPLSQCHRLLGYGSHAHAFPSQTNNRLYYTCFAPMRATVSGRQWPTPFIAARQAHQHQPDWLLLVFIVKLWSMYGRDKVQGDAGRGTADDPAYPVRTAADPQQPVRAAA